MSDIPCDECTVVIELDHQPVRCTIHLKSKSNAIFLLLCKELSLCVD